VRATCAAIAALALLAGSASAAQPYDLNGDGRDELVLGLPDYVHERSTLGALVAPGSSDALLGRRAILTRRSLLGERERYPEVGEAVTSADLDGDGFADLVLGVPGLSSDPDDYHGGLVVAYGSPDLVGERRLVIKGPPTDPASDLDSTEFGASVVAADFTGDGHPDLAVGAPRYDWPDDEAHPAGAVYLLVAQADGGFGEAVALARPSGRRFSRFGSDLAVGDVNADGHVDLIEADDGTPGDIDALRKLPGHLTVALGGPSGPTQFEPVEHDFRGGPTSLAVGDVTGDDYPDLVAGVAEAAFWRFDAPRSAGEVLVWPGGAAGPAAQPITIDQETSGIAGSNERGDDFGLSVAVARLDGDRFADIVVGVRGEDRARGRVLILRGARDGIRRRGHTVVPRPRKAIAWGFRIALHDFNGDGRRDLALDHAERRTDATVITLLRGIRGGFAGRDVRRLRLGRAFEEGDYFSVLARAGSSS